jgi:hypothetical protein
MQRLSTMSVAMKEKPKQKLRLSKHSKTQLCDYLFSAFLYAFLILSVMNERMVIFNHISMYTIVYLFVVCLTALSH